MRPPFDDLLAALQVVAGLYSRVYIIVDALDECKVAGGCREEFLKGIFDLQAKCAANIFATSRIIPEITDKFEKYISLEIKASEEDVWRYVDGHILNLPSFLRRDSDLQGELKRAIVKAVDGMYVIPSSV